MTATITETENIDLDLFRDLIREELNEIEILAVWDARCDPETSPFR